MTTLLGRQPPPVAPRNAIPGDYPTLFRRGHQFEIALGQRLALGGFKGPNDVAFGPDGLLYVLNRYPTDQGHLPRNRWVRVDLNDDGYENDVVPLGPDGKEMERGNEWLVSLVMCVCDSKGTIYSADEHRNVVVRVKTTGETVGYWGESGTGPGKLNAPTGICLDADENLWIVNTRSHRVDHYTPEGKWLGGFGKFGVEPGRLNYPWGVAVDPVNGTVVVADWRNDRVLLFNYRGMFQESFIGDAVINERGMRKVLTNLDMVRMRDNISNLDREKRLKRPVSVRVDNKGRVYIVDSGRYRIQVYKKWCRVLKPDEVDSPTLHVDPELT